MRAKTSQVLGYAFPFAVVAMRSDGPRRSSSPLVVATLIFVSLGASVLVTNRRSGTGVGDSGLSVISDLVTSPAAAVDGDDSVTSVSALTTDDAASLVIDWGASSGASEDDQLMASGGDADTQPSGDDPAEATGSGGVSIGAGDDDDATDALDGTDGSASVPTPTPSVSSAASAARGAGVPPTAWHVPPTTSEMAPPMSNVTNDTTTGAANGTSGCEFRHVWYVDKRGRNDYRKGQVKNGYCWHGAFSTLSEALINSHLGDEIWASRRHAPRCPVICRASSSRLPSSHGRTAHGPPRRRPRTRDVLSSRLSRPPVGVESLSA